MAGLATVCPEGDSYVERVAGGERRERAASYSYYMCASPRRIAAAELELIVKLGDEANDARACSCPVARTDATRSACE